VRIVLFFLAVFALSRSCYADVTPPYDVLREFVREQVEAKNNDDQAKHEFSSIDKDDRQQLMGEIIRNGTLVKLRLSETIGRLQRMRLDKPFDTLIPTLIRWQERKKALYDEMVTTAKTFMEGPKPGVDYGKLAAHMPEISASLEYVDESIFKLTPMIGMMLISQKPDSHGHLSHFAITRQQANDVLGMLQRNFGVSMDAKERGWATTSASVLRTYLRDKGFKFSDDPWQ
jgi:hypothetical protein